MTGRRPETGCSPSSAATAARWLVSALVLAVLFGNQGFRSLARNWLELRHLRREIAALEAEQARLDRRLSDLKEGGLALEREARRIGFVHPGEIEYRFPPPAPETP